MSVKAKDDALILHFIIDASLILYLFVSYLKSFSAFQLLNLAKFSQDLTKLQFVQFILYLIRDYLNGHLILYHSSELTNIIFVCEYDSPRPTCKSDKE